jgi:hypothetical protein
MRIIILCYRRIVNWVTNVNNCFNSNSVLFDHSLKSFSGSGGGVLFHILFNHEINSFDIPLYLFQSNGKRKNKPFLVLTRDKAT